MIDKPYTREQDCNMSSLSSFTNGEYVSKDLIKISRTCLKGLKLDVHRREDARDQNSEHYLRHGSWLDESDQTSKPQFPLHFRELPVIIGWLVARK